MIIHGCIEIHPKDCGGLIIVTGFRVLLISQHLFPEILLEAVLVYKWLKSLRFPDGHASNLSRLVNIEDCRLYEMKSHDCHVFMQTLIPLAFHDLLPKGI